MKRSFLNCWISPLVIVALVFGGLNPEAHAMRRPAGVPSKEEEAKKAEEQKASQAAAAASKETEEKAPADQKIASRSQVTVLGYHRFVDKVKRPDTEITPADFEAQMQTLKDQGISVISMDDFLAWKRGEKEIPAKSAVITLDDGWRSQYTRAWPILKKFDYPFTMFVYTDYIRGGKRTGGESISWEELAEMRDAGVNIEGHTVSHQDLRGKKETRGTPAYEQWLWNELHGSKEMIENRLGVKVRALALPYGFYNEAVQKMAMKAGYEAIFTVYGQKVFQGGKMDAIGRTVVESNKPKVFASAINFGESTSGASAPAVAERSSSDLQAEPADGSTVKNSQPTLKANLKSFGEIDPASVKVRISSIGPVQAAYDKATQTLTWRPSKALRPNQYTVIITASAKGKKQEGRWSFTVAPETVADEPSGENESEAEGTDAAKSKESEAVSTPLPKETAIPASSPDEEEAN